MAFPGNAEYRIDQTGITLMSAEIVPTTRKGYQFKASFRALPGTNLGTIRSAIWISSPV